MFEESSKIIQTWLSSPPQHLLFGSLGRSLACADPPEPERLTILNEAWKVITKVRSPQVLLGSEFSLTEKVLRSSHVSYMFVFSRITSTVLRSGWSSPADTSQWVNLRRRRTLCFTDRNLELEPLSHFSVRNVRSTLSWQTSSSTWPLTGHLRTLILRSASHWLSESDSFSCSVLTALLFVFMQLQSVIRKILTYFHDFSVLFSMVSKPNINMKQHFESEPELPDVHRCFCFTGTLPAISGHVPERQCKGGGLQIYHGSLHQVRNY